MKTFNRTYLPDSINYNGEEFTANMAISSAMNANNTSPNTIARTLKQEGRKCILVFVLARSLRGVNNLHGKPYQPSKWIFTNK